MILLCSGHQFRSSIIILSTSVPIYDVSDTGFLAGCSVFALFFFSKGIDDLITNRVICVVCDFSVLPSVQFLSVPV